MQRPDAHPLRGFLTLGFLLAITGTALALLNAPNSAEFVASVCSAAMGVFLIAGSLVLIRILRPQGDD